VLDDKIVRRIDNAAEYQRGDARNDAGLDQIVAIGRQPQFDVGRDLLEPSEDDGDEGEFDVAVGRYCEHSHGLRRIETLLAQHRVIEFRECIGDRGRKLQRDGGWLNRVPLADEQWILQHPTQTRERVGQRRLRHPDALSGVRRGERSDHNLSISVTSRGNPAVPDRPGQGPGSGQSIAPGNMAAFCRGEASAKYGVRPAYIATGKLVTARDGGRTVDGSADRGSKGSTRFRCTFDVRGRFVEVVSLSR
jgi:hypothetical protein